MENTLCDQIAALITGYVPQLVTVGLAGFGVYLTIWAFRKFRGTAK